MDETFYNLTVATTNAEDMRNLLSNIGQVPDTHMPTDQAAGQMSVLSITDESCSKDCDCDCEGECGPDCPCYSRGDEQMNEIKRAQELAGITEDFKNTYDVGDHVKTPIGSGRIISVKKDEKNGRPVVKLDKSDDPEGDTFTLDWSSIQGHVTEDGYDYREMSKPEPNDFDRRGSDFDAFAKKGHVKKSKKRVNDYGDNPMAEKKEWVKPWEKDKDKDKDEDDDAEEINENELFEKLLTEYEEFKLDESVSQWIIMNATKKVFGKIRLSLDEIIANEYFDNGCIMIVNFDHGQSVFVYGLGQKPYGIVGETRDFVQDTGNGYGRRGQLEIENFAVVTNGEIMTTANGVGLSEKRPLWVFK